LIESPHDVSAKIKIARRNGSGGFVTNERPALRNILDFIVAIVESKDPKVSSSLPVI
jgi:hypothetical protein